MRYYLSSFRMGSSPRDYLKLSHGPKIVAYIPNAIDYIDDMNFRDMVMENDINDLEALGLKVLIVDLKDFFSNSKELIEIMNTVGYIWVTGGNVFVLNQAFKLSGFDKIIGSYADEDRDLVYGGFSCGTYVLRDKLNGYELVDDIDVNPYGIDREQAFEGLGLLNYSIIPHYKSRHSESHKIDEVVKYMKSNKRDYKLLRDGEVIIV